MSAEDLATGIAALEDDDVRTAVAAGDLTAFAELELTDEEIGLLEAAASDYPDVVGFDIRAGLLDLGVGAPGSPVNAMEKSVGQTIQDVTLNQQKGSDKAAAAADAILRG